MHDEVKAINGDGGVIVLDKTGNYTMSFNSEGIIVAQLVMMENPLSQFTKSNLNSH